MLSARAALTAGPPADKGNVMWPSQEKVWGPLVKLEGKTKGIKFNGLRRKYLRLLSFRCVTFYIFFSKCKGTTRRFKGREAVTNRISLSLLSF